MAKKIEAERIEAKEIEAYVDTSAFIAFMDSSDSYHPLFYRLFAAPPQLITSSLVIAEGHGWFLKRYNNTRALQFMSFIESLGDLRIAEVGEPEIACANAGRGVTRLFRLHAERCHSHLRHPGPGLGRDEFRHLAAGIFDQFRLPLRQGGCNGRIDDRASCLTKRPSLAPAYDPDEALHINTIMWVQSTNLLFCFGCKILQRLVHFNVQSSFVTPCEFVTDLICEKFRYFGFQEHVLLRLP